MRKSLAFIITILMYAGGYSQPVKINFENFTTESGLSNDLVHNVFQDKRGWMWFGTYHGLNRFDGYKFTIFDHVANDSCSLGGAIIRSIFEDKDGLLLIGTESQGVCVFNRNKENFSRLDGKISGFNLREQTINAMAQDRNGFLWLGTDNGLCQTDVSGKIIKLYQNIADDPNTLHHNSVKVIFIDRNDKIWVGTREGLDILDAHGNKITHVSTTIKSLNDEIMTILCDNDSKIWVGTSRNGITIVDPATLQSEHLMVDPDNDRSINVRAIVKDRDGFYWIGTRGGLYIYSKADRRFSFFKHDERENESIIHNSVLDIFKDKKGDLWIATRGGLSYVVRERQIFQCYRALPNDNHFLNNGEIYAFWMDPHGKLWIGTETGGVNIFDRSNGTFSYITKKEKGVSGLSGNCIKAITSDKQGDVWIGTFMGGITVINSQTKQCRYLKNDPHNDGSLPNNKVWSLYNDSKNNMWVGTESGLDRFDFKTQRFIHYKDVIRNNTVIWIKEDSNHDLWIGTNIELVIYNPSTQAIRRFKEKTRMMHEDQSGRFWLTTLDKGLALFDKHTGITKIFDKSKGIVNNQTYCILEDNKGYLWISTIDGLSRFDPRTEQFKNFDRQDGLQNNQFKYGACCKTDDDELIFGGITGFNIFKPSEVKENEYEPPIVFTDLKVFNRHVSISDDKESLLKNSISEIQKIVLPYSKNVITLEFAALNYAQASKNKYSFRLEGFENEWGETGDQRSATYTNLNPGKYTFQVRASNNDNVWNKNTRELSIEIMPPYWKTLWFKTILALLLLLIIYLTFRFMVSRTHLKHELAYERERTQMLYELDMMKVSFFTNVSHELRTPLTLITSPLEKILHSEMSVKEIKTYLTLVNRNARQLQRLVNQLLDFRKIESGNLKLEFNQGDIILFLKDITASFSALAEEKKIDLKFTSAEKEIFALFDSDKLEKIVNNLLSNAFKFTPEGGTISVKINFEETISAGADRNGSGKNIEIVVEDNGIGIPESNQDKIFNRFFESGNSKNSIGTGIGLALTRELVKLHNGTIAVESKPDIGTRFVVKIPLPISAGVIEEGTKEPYIRSTDHVVPAQNESTPKKVLLIVDDNADVRFYIRSHFEKDYEILEANNGKEGLRMAFKNLPDLVISDIMMPLVDGKEFVKRLKKDERTYLTPIILLTALSSKADKMEGLNIGADDYITKPFDITLLESKVENLLMVRNMLREKYSSQMVLKPRNIIIDNPDEKFLKNVIEAIENNITDPDFDIDKLSVEVGVSRTQLYRKLSTLTDLTAREFIKSIRLKRAAQLLEQNKINVSEVAFAVGFRDTSHFRKSFRKEFGMNASEYVARFSKEK